MTDLLDRPAAPEDDDSGADAFAVLGLPYSPDLTDEDVHQAFRRRLRAAHPDAGGDGEAAAAVTAAYSALRSGVRRGEVLAAAMTERRDPVPPAAREPRPGRPRLRRTGADAPMPSEAERAILRVEVAAGRVAQGLPPFITDPVVLARIASLVVAMEAGADARAAGREPRPAGADWHRSSPAGRPLSSWRLAGRRRFMTEADPEWERAAAAVEAAGASWWRRGWARVRYGRPVWLAGRLVLAGAVVAVAQLVVPGDPAVPALGAGAVTWLVLTGRLDLAPGRRQ